MLRNLRRLVLLCLLFLAAMIYRPSVARADGCCIGYACANCVGHSCSPLYCCQNCVMLWQINDPSPGEGHYAAIYDTSCGSNCP